MLLMLLQPETIRADGTVETVMAAVVGFFSLEMSAEQLATRIIAEQTEIASNKIRRGLINDADFENIKDIFNRAARPAVLCRRDWRSFDRRN